jgi:tryptophan halogenase
LVDATEQRAPRRILIVGGGTAGWMAAAALARFLESGWEIALVESEAIGTVGVGEATIPQVRLFNAALGLDEDAFLAATEGSYKLGIAFTGWGAPGETYCHGFGSVGRDLGLVPFHHYWRRGRALGIAGPLADYCPNVVAAFANRFDRQVDAGNPARPPMPYAFHFDAALYAAHLRAYAEARGVTRLEGRITDVALDGEDGAIAGVRLDGDRALSADLYLDCSGFRGLLMEALGVAYEDWTRWLPCDRALAVPSVRTEPLTPYTRATARRAGWQWRIPLQHRTGNGLVWCSAEMTDEEAAETLLAHLDSAPLAEPRPVRFTTGRRARFWKANCVALGLASGFLEPLESTSIHLVQSAIERLLAFLPAGTPDPRAIAEYNRQTAWEMERIRDFLTLHYHANQRPEPFWRACAAMALPENLAARIALFREAGRIFRDGNELFTEAGWVQVLIGQNILPDAWHPLADQLAPAELAGFLALIARLNRERAAAMPDHAAFLAARRAQPMGAAA